MKDEIFSVSCVVFGFLFLDLLNSLGVVVVCSGGKFASRKDKNPAKNFSIGF